MLVIARILFTGVSLHAGKEL